LICSNNKVRDPDDVLSWYYGLTPLFVGGRNARQFAASNGINEQTFYNWISKYEKGEFVESSNPYQKRVRSSLFPTVEVELHRFLQAFDEWYALHHSSENADNSDPMAHARPQISRQVLQAKAKEIAAQVLPPDQRAHFTGGTNWINRYIRRYNLAQKVSMDTAAVVALSEQDLQEIDTISKQIDVSTFIAMPVNPSAAADVYDEHDDHDESVEMQDAPGVTADGEDVEAELAGKNRRSRRKH
jgi:hypothetical protein